MTQKQPQPLTSNVPLCLNLVCFVVDGDRGSGKDFCITGGTILAPSTNFANPMAHQQTDSRIEQLSTKQREPGLIRLAYETVIAQICIDANAQYSL